MPCEYQEFPDFYGYTDSEIESFRRQKFLKNLRAQKIRDRQEPEIDDGTD